MRSLVCVGLLLAALVLSGCSSGGGGVPPPVPETLLQITEANAREVVQAVGGTVDILDSLSPLLMEMMGLFGLGLPSFDENCPDGGTIIATINNEAPVDEPSAGDSATITFTLCGLNVDDEDVVIGGQLAISISSFEFLSEDTDFFAAVATYTLTGLSVTFPGPMTVTITGDLVAEITRDPDGTMTQVLRGSSLRITLEGMTQPGTLRMSSYRHETMVDEGSGQFSADIRGTLYSSALGGAVNYDTLETVTGVGEGDPSDGRIEATGAAASSVILEVIDDVNVELRVDTDGDGQPERILPETWSSLFP